LINATVAGVSTTTSFNAGALNLKDLNMPNSEAVLKFAFTDSNTGEISLLSDLALISSTVHTLIEHVSTGTQTISMNGLSIGTSTTIKKHILKKTNGIVIFSGPSTIDLTADSGAQLFYYDNCAATIAGITYSSLTVSGDFNIYKVMNGNTGAIAIGTETITLLTDNSTSSNNFALYDFYNNQALTLDTFAITFSAAETTNLTKFVFKFVSKPNTADVAYTLDNITCTKCISVIYCENEAGDANDSSLAVGGTITMTTTTSAIHFLKMLQADV
jgi:hypothetical protein